MKYVYPNTVSTFTGNKKIALKAGYVELDDELYADLIAQKKMWQDGELVDNPDYEGIQREQTAKEQRQSVLDEIDNLKRQLAETDYMAIKHSEGWISDEDYASVKALRQSYRDSINALESTLD